MRVPVTVRVLLAVGLALWLVDARPVLTVHRLEGHGLVSLFFGELIVGVSIALAPPLAFASIP